MAICGVLIRHHQPNSFMLSASLMIDCMEYNNSAHDRIAHAC